MSAELGTQDKSRLNEEIRGWGGGTSRASRRNDVGSTSNSSSILFWITDAARTRHFALRLSLLRAF
eukprot:757436-Hanusia_phi.AAC.13